MIHGRLPLTVKYAILQMRDVLPSSSLMLVTSIDSTTSPADIMRILAGAQWPTPVSENPIYRLAQIDVSGLAVFNGFDEVYLMSELPSFDLRDWFDSSAVAPEDFAEMLPEDVAVRFTGTHLIALLGDGEGLNFATGDEAIARCLHNSRTSRA